MTSVTLDSPALAGLRQATGLVEIRDPEGTVIGFFAPVNLERAPLYAEAAARIDPQELRRRKEANETPFPSEQVLDHLGRLENPRRSTRWFGSPPRRTS